MRCNSRRWLWGLIPLAVASWAAVQVERGRIEQDLTERASKTLAERGAAWASVVFSGRDAELTGRALQDSQPVEAEEALRKVWGVRAVDNKAVLPPKVEPFLWAARRRGNRIRLSGYVPDRATRRTIIGMANAALPGFEVADRMLVARGIPPADTWLAGLSFALKQLASLKQGNVRLDDLALSISGEAEDAASYRSVNAALKSGLPKGIKLTSAQITAPVASPYVWSAQFAGGQLVLSGHVPSEGAKSELLAAAATAPPGTNVVDRMEFAEGSSQGWVALTVVAVKELVRLLSGNAELKDAALSVSGIASDESQAQAVRAALRGAASPAFKFSDQIRVREAAVPKAEPLPAAPEPQIPPVPLLKPSESAPQPKASPAEPAPKEAAPKQAEPVPQPGPAPVEPVPKQAVVAPPAKEARPALQPPPPAEPAPKVAAAPPAPAVTAPQGPANVCQEHLSKVAGGGHILFNTDSATLDTTSYEVLDRLAAAAKTCAGLRIAIEGHTDGEGSAQYNQRLSERRARAVEAYLVKSGADRKQLEAAGYGRSRPAVPNDTLENMARNRRIEFVVRQQ